MSGSHATKPFKQRAHELVEQLPDDADWRELIYRASIRQDIDEGLKESDAGRITELEEVMKEFRVADE